ncbi:MAG: hypothetical protein Q7R79_04460 [bacterium]|nr:hypothetical protein [bacterium]
MVTQSGLHQNIPAGKTRVIFVDLFSHEDGIIKDCDTREEAFALADTHNKGRSGSMDDVYYVYDDQGNYIRGNEDVDGPGMSP